MKVMQIISPSEPDGVEADVATLSVALVDRGDQVMIVGSPRNRDLFEGSIKSGVEYVPTNSTRRVQLAKELHALMWKTRPDVVQSHTFDRNLSAALAAMLSGVPMIATVHHVVQGVGRRKRRVAHAVLSKLASRVVGVSDSVVRAMLASGVPQRKMTRVYNGVDVARYDLGKNDKLRHKLGLKQDCLLVGVYTDNPETISRVAAILATRFPECRFVIFSDDFCPTSRLGADVMSYQELEDALGSLDLFVFASESDQIPISVIKAMASGLPVVAIDSAGAREAIKDGFTGYIVRSSDNDGLASRIEMLLDSASERKSMGVAARERAVQFFSCQSMAQAYHTLYLASLGVKVDSDLR